MRVRAPHIVSLCLLFATAACMSTTNTDQASSSPPPATAPATTLIPTSATPVAPVVADPTLKATTVATDGSVGIRKGMVRLTELNHGPTAPALTLTFAAIPAGVQIDGTEWSTCTKADKATSTAVTCPLAPVAAGGQSQTLYHFVNIDLGVAQDLGDLTLAAVGATETNISDNKAKLLICTNGCSDWQQ